MKRWWSETFPTRFELWNNLPNEIKALVVQKMDVKTRDAFKNCGPNELELVRRFAKNDVNICVRYDKFVSSEYEEMIIKLGDAETNNLQLKWSLSAEAIRSTKVVYSGFKDNPLLIKKKNVRNTLSMILRRLLTEPMFVVKKLELKMGKYNKMINFGSTIANIELLFLNGCENPDAVSSILRNKNLKFNIIVGITSSDRKILYNFEKSIHGGPRSLPQNSLFHLRMPDYCSMLFNLESESRMKSLQSLAMFWAITFRKFTFINIQGVRRKMNLPKIIDDIMCFRAAYYYKNHSVKYLRSFEIYEKKITFLRRGIDGYLSDYQLYILIIAYLVRLLRNEPAIRRIHNTAFEDLRLAVKKYEHLNWYGKLVAKIKLLLP